MLAYRGVRTWARRLLPAAAVALLLGGCGAGGGGGGDTAREELPLACRPGLAPEGWTYPPGPYGVDVGDRFEDLTLENCDGDDVNFGDILSGARLVLFNVGAGWCTTCVEEAEFLEADVHRAFCERGLRVVQVLFEDQSGRPATKLFCGEWTRAFGLAFPVLVDPLFVTGAYLDAEEAPLNILVDAGGEIRFRDTGEFSEALMRRIDELLPP